MPLFTNPADFIIKLAINPSLVTKSGVTTLKLSNICEKQSNEELTSEQLIIRNDIIRSSTIR